MLLRLNLRTTISRILQIGLGSSNWKTNGSSTSPIEARNEADSAYVIGRGDDPVGPNDWVTLQHLRGRFSNLLQWNLNGPLRGYPTDTTAMGSLAADGGPGTFDGSVHVNGPQTLSEIRLINRTPGTSGNTSVELIRLRGAAFFSLGIATVSGVVAFQMATVVPVDPALVAGDIIFVRLREAQNGSPMDITLQVRTV